MTTTYVIQYQNPLPSTDWHDYKNPQTQFVLNNAKNLKPMENELNRLRLEFKHRLWRLVERSEEVVG